MRKFFGLSVAVTCLIMTALLILVMVANKQSEARLKELDSYLSTFETTRQSRSWVRIEAPEEASYQQVKESTEITVFETEETTEASCEQVTSKLDASYEQVEYSYDYSSGDVLNAHDGINYYYGVLETYYNLPMEGVVDWMHSLGYDYEY